MVKHTKPTLPKVTVAPKVTAPAPAPAPAPSAAAQGAAIAQAAVAALANTATSAQAPGNHGNMWRATCKAKLPHNATLAYGMGHNPWRANSNGHAFYSHVLAKKPATVGAAMQLAKQAGIAGAMGHLAWFVTWAIAAKPQVGGLHLYMPQTLGQALAALWAMPPTQGTVVNPALTAAQAALAPLYANLPQS